MRKLFFLAVAVIGLAACNKDGFSSSNAGDAIQFGAYSARATKAPIVTFEDLKQNGFCVMSIYGGYKYFNIAVKYEGEETSRFPAVDNAKKYYWPANLSAENPIYFYAVNQGLLQFDEIAKTVSFALDQTAALSPGYQKDIVVASASASAVPTTSTYANPNYQDGVQDLLFSHALTKINFSLEGADQASGLTYTVTSLKVKVKTAGTYTFGATTPWATTGDVSACSYVIDGRSAVLTDTNRHKDLGANMMVIPQEGSSEITNDGAAWADCEITYTVQDGNTVLFDGTKEFAIPTTKIAGDNAWTAQKSYRYTLTLTTGAKPIYFAAAVDGWDAEINGGTITVK